jgi:hypothetical protein
LRLIFCSWRRGMNDCLSMPMLRIRRFTDICYAKE